MIAITFEGVTDELVFPDTAEGTFAVSVHYRSMSMNCLEGCNKSAHYECLNETTETCGAVNCCIVGFMSKCGAGPLVTNQRACRFFKMSSAGNRCMHYCVALDGHCDSIDAQQEMKNREPSQN